MIRLSLELELTEEDVLALLMRRHMEDQPELSAALRRMDFATGVGTDDPSSPPVARGSPEPDPAPAPAPLAKIQPPLAEIPASDPRDPDTGKPEPQAEPAPSPEPVAEAKAEPAKPAKPASSRTQRAAATNGSKPVEAAPQPPPAEADLRATLSRYNALHPAKIGGVVALLKEHGGHSRLIECPLNTWGAIQRAAEAFIAAAQPPVAIADE